MSFSVPVILFQIYFVHFALNILTELYMISSFIHGSSFYYCRELKMTFPFFLQSKVVRAATSF